MTFSMAKLLWSYNDLQYWLTDIHTCYGIWVYMTKSNNAKWFTACILPKLNYERWFPDFFTVYTHHLNSNFQFTLCAHIIWSNRKCFPCFNSRIIIIQVKGYCILAAFTFHSYAYTVKSFWKYASFQISVWCITFCR